VLGEAYLGAGRGMDNIIHLKLVPDLGAGVLVNGTLARGAHGFAGELGHLHYDKDGPLCFCGSRGCLRQLLNIPNIVDKLRPAYPQNLTFEDVVHLAAQADAGVHRIVSDLGLTLGHFLATACVLLNPQAIVVDGSLGAAAQPFIDGLREGIRREVPTATLHGLQIVPGILAGRAEVLGAAVLVRRHSATSRAWRSQAE
jgi:predicted NBD/HSP70 family sugar kinase